MKSMICGKYRTLLIYLLSNLKSGNMEYKTVQIRTVFYVGILYKDVKILKNMREKSLQKNYMPNDIKKT